MNADKSFVFKQRHRGLFSLRRLLDDHLRRARWKAARGHQHIDVAFAGHRGWQKKIHLIDAGIGAWTGIQHWRGHPISLWR